MNAAAARRLLDNACAAVLLQRKATPLANPLARQKEVMALEEEYKYLICPISHKDVDDLY